MTAEPKPLVPHDSLILVGDGQKALFLRNRGSAQHVDLVVERILERDNPPTREQGTGRSTASPGVARSAMQEVDWHHLAKERFADELAEALYRYAHADGFQKLVIIAPPKILGNLRRAFHAEGPRSYRRRDPEGIDDASGRGDREAHRRLAAHAAQIYRTPRPTGMSRLHHDRSQTAFGKRSIGNFTK
jgi:protein required for attachment to host cells